ncbi:MAG: replication-relaxation family protein [Oscillospiraceae bacterium]|nr:replication-relaxation family protein [Oscillospiraceae bacterium]
MEILRLVYRFKFCLGRHVGLLVEFTGFRASDRRLKALVEAGYLSRKKYLYGIPYLYTLTHKGRILIGANKRENKIRLEQISHDIAVLGAVIFFKEKYRLALADIESEKDLHIKNGFGMRRHQPDFVFSSEGKKYAVELELTAKAKSTLEKNVRENYLNYDHQIWITGDNKVFALLQNLTNEYANMTIEKLEGMICHEQT